VDGCRNPRSATHSSATSQAFIGRSFSGPGEVYRDAGRCGWTQASPGPDGVEMAWARSPALTGYSVAGRFRDPCPTCLSPRSGLQPLVSGSAYPLLRLSALECLSSLTDVGGLICPLLTSALRSDHLSTASVAAADTEQISWGKLSRLPCTAVGSTLRTLDGYGLRGKWAARPELTPCIRFLSIDSHVCSTLPSDPTSRWSPLRFTSPSPPSGWAEDFHLQAAEHGPAHH
jgi:hypothetical protein